MSNPFATPAAAGGVSWEDLDGRLLLIEPLSQEHGISTVHGEKDAIRANVTVLDGDTPDEKFEDTLVFPLVLQGQLRPRIGQKVLGRLGKGVGKPGQKPPWKLAEATEAEIQVGTAYLAGGISKPAETHAAPF